MKWKYKAIMLFLTLLIFCVGNVCAVEPDNTTVNNQAVKINELNNTVNNQSVVINNLKADNQALTDLKKVLNVKIKALEDSNKVNTTNISNNYKKIVEHNKKLTSANKNISNKTITKVNKLNAENKKISKKDIYNSLKGLSSTKNFKNIKCGQYTFKLKDYLKVPLIKKGKSHVMKFKKDKGRLPNYVIIAGYKVPKNVYQKLYNI